jgi:hypothetical protein
MVTQGAKTQLYVWLATQFIATTEKDAIKAMANKLLGRQDDKTEIDATIDRTRDTHPKLRANDLMTLKRGEFIFVPIDGPVKKVYVPIGDQQETKHEPVAQAISQEPTRVPRVAEKPIVKIHPNPQVPQISSGHHASSTEKRRVESVRETPHEVVKQTLPNITIQQFKPTLSFPVEMLEQPTTTLGRVVVVLKNYDGRADQWTIKAIKQDVRDHAWDDSGVEEAIDQLLRWEIIKRKSNYLKFYSERVQIIQVEAEMRVA